MSINSHQSKNINHKPTRNPSKTHPQVLKNTAGETIREIAAGEAEQSPRGFNLWRRGWRKLGTFWTGKITCK